MVFFLFYFSPAMCTFIYSLGLNGPIALSCLLSFRLIFLVSSLFTFLAGTHSIASHCISLTVLMSHLFPLPLMLLLLVVRSVVAPGNAPLGVRVEPLSSKSVRVKWKVRKKVKRKSVLSSLFSLFFLVSSLLDSCIFRQHFYFRLFSLAIFSLCSICV